MRNRVTSAYKHPAFRLIAVALLAGTAAGCSSDVTRFDSLYSSADNLTTGSINHNSNVIDGRVPTPSENIASASPSMAQSDLSDPMSQPMPPAQANSGMYNSSMAASSVRRINDAPVQSASLSSPLPAAAPSQQPIVAPQPKKVAAAVLPNGKPARIVMTKGPDPVSTGTIPATAAQVKKPELAKQVAAIDTKAPVHVPTPGSVPAQQAAIVPAAPQADKKKIADAKVPAPAGNVYKVASGDTLRTIAKKTGVSVDALKAANGLTSSSVRVGQDLKLPSAKVASAAPVAAAPAAAQKPEVKAPAAADAVKTGSIGADDAAKPKAYQPPVADAKESVSKAADTETASNAPAVTGIGKYRWPVTGAVIAGYGANVEGQRNDGIDISVPEGTPVKAAENGVVIYAGNGLEKLGNTVLIRHGDGKVTVYAHLKNLDVNRGDKVNRGQVVADSGMSGNASRPKLHFEVRKDSAPINPISFLE